MDEAQDICKNVHARAEVTQFSFFNIWSLDMKSFARICCRRWVFGNFTFSPHFVWDKSSQYFLGFGSNVNMRVINLVIRFSLLLSVEFAFITELLPHLMNYLRSAQCELLFLTIPQFDDPTTSSQIFVCNSFKCSK